MAERKNSARARRARAEQPDENASPLTARDPLARERAREAQATTPAARRDAQRIRSEGGFSPRRNSSASAGTHTAGKAGATGERFIVLHGMVGPHTAGSIVKQRDFVDGVDMQRLLDLQAIRPLTRDEDADNPDDEAYFEEAPLETLSEALRSDSPPTLPYAPAVAASQADLNKAAASPSAHIDPLPETQEEAERMSEEAQEQHSGS